MSRIALAPWTAAAAVAAVMAATPVGALHAEDRTPPRLMTLTGTGEVSAEPDTAIVTIGVVEEAKTARDALSANTEAMTGVMETLKGQKIADKDIQTSGFSISPRYVYPKNGEDQPPKVVAYQVSNQVTVKVRDLDALGGLLDKVVSAGSNRISGISFTIDDAQEMEDEARRRAVADARRKAELYAKAAGVKLGDVRQISEAGGAQPPMPMMRTMAMEAKADGAVPVARGEQTITVRVNIAWEIE